MRCIKSKRSRRQPTHDSTPGPASEPDQPGVDPTAPERRRIETWSIAVLKQHHLQAVTFHDLVGEEFVRFVESMRKGLDVPIEITPDGTIIDGHQRVRAARELEWDEITVWVRDDIAGDQDAIDRRHLDANRNRRHLDPLDKVRLARRLAEMELRRSPGGDSSTQEQEELRDRVGGRIGYSGRHAQRLLSILSTPMAVQRAFSRGKLPLVHADKVSRLGWTKQKQIAEEIEAGGGPAEIVASYLPTPRPKDKPDKTYKKMMTELARGLDTLEGHVAQLRSVFRRRGPGAHRPMDPFS